MKKSILLVVAVFLSIAVFAQFKLLGESQVFEENEEGWGRILLMKNGNTVYFETNRKKMHVRIFNSQFKEIAYQDIDPAFYKKKHSYIESIFEINGNVVIMGNQAEDRTPQLVRVIIDGNTGVLLEERKIAELLRMGNKDGYAMLFGGVPVPDFCVRKDPKSDYYAVAQFNSFESDRNKRIEIVWYGPDHKEVNRAYYASPDDRYKYMVYIDMTVIGKEMVSILIKAYNTRSSGGNETDLLLGKLVPGSKSISATKLKFSKDMIIDGGIVRYNWVTKRLILLAAIKETPKSDGYIPFLAYLNPETNSADFTGIAFPEQANNKSLELFGSKKRFKGMPQNLYINNDGTFSVLFEEGTTISSENITNGITGNVAIANFSIIGTSTGSYFIPKSHSFTQYSAPTFYLSNHELKPEGFGLGNQFKEIAYIDGTKKTYLLFNDIEKNEESVKKGKITTISSVSDCDGFYFNISGDEVMPERKYFFGKPEEKRAHNLAIFSMSEYSRDRDLFVTLKLENDRGNKGVKLVWMRPE